MGIEKIDCIDKRGEIVKKNIIIMLAILIIVLSGCTQKVEKNESSEVIDVYTSIYPIYDFATKIGGEKASVKLLVPAGMEPHHFSIKPKDMVKLENADILMYNGLNMEVWIDQIIGSLSSEELLIAKVTEGVEVLEIHETKDEEDIHEESEEEAHQDEDSHAHGKSDPHVWLDPLNAMKQAENIKEILIKKDPDNQEYYEKNYRELKDKLEKLHETYKENLKDLKQRKFVVSHAAFGYLAHRYELEQIFVSGLTPQEEPSSAKMAEIVDIIMENEIKYVFFETLTNSKLSKVIAHETGAEVLELNPLGGLSQEKIDAGDDYFSVMEKNLENLLKALKEK